MPQAVTHVLIPLILSDIYRDYFSKVKFNRKYVLLAGLAGLLPDIDIALAWILKLFSDVNVLDLHRTLTHTIFFLLFFLILFLITKNYNLKFLKKHKLKLNYIFLAVAFGIFIHLLLDALLAGQLALVYPLSTYLVGLKLNLNFFQDTFYQGLDAILLFLWLIHEEFKHKIKDYI